MKKNLKLLISSTFVALAFSIPQKTQGMEDSYKLVEQPYDPTVTYSAGYFHHYKDGSGSILSTHSYPPQEAYNQKAFIYKKAPQEPRQEKILAKIIPGYDGRVRISPTTQWPYNICAQITTIFDGNTYGGSGCLVGPHHVLTCAHNVYDSDENKWAEKILLYPALNGNNAPFGEVKVVKVFTFKGWIAGGNKSLDMALLILNKSIGKYTGWGGLLSTADNEISQEKVCITGYPGDKGLKQMWSMEHKIKTIKPEQFDYEIDTYGGQSGSPVWINKWGSAKILGVHTLGTNSINSGVRLSEKKFTSFIEVISATYILDNSNIVAVTVPSIAATLIPSVNNSNIDTVMIPPAAATVTAPPVNNSNIIPLRVSLDVPQEYKRYQQAYRRFLSGRLIYKPHKNNDLGKIELRIADLRNPLEGTFNLSRCGNTGQHLSISTGYRQTIRERTENADKVGIWIAPRFLVKKRRSEGRAEPLIPIFPSKWPDAALVGIFWTKGSWQTSTYDYLTHQSTTELSNGNLLTKWNEITGMLPPWGHRTPPNPYLNRFKLDFGN